MKLLTLLSAALSLPLLLVPPPAWAEGLEAEAARQVGLCRDDLANGQYERAVAACDSALKLDPTREVQQDAFKLKGLALEQLGQLDDARAMLLAFKSLRAGLADDLEVEEALARIDSRPGRTQRPRREPRELPPPSEKVLVPVLIGVGGASLSAAGWIMHLDSDDRAWARMYEDGDSVLYFGPRSEYKTLLDQNRAGVVMGLAGAGIAAAGLVLAVVEATGPAKSTAAHDLPTPWLTAGPYGMVLGLAGGLP